MNIAKPTLAGLITALDPETRLFIVRRIGPHECEAVAENTAGELQANGRVEACGENAVIGLSIELDGVAKPPVPVLLVTIEEKDVAAECYIRKVR